MGCLCLEGSAHPVGLPVKPACTRVHDIRTRNAEVKPLGDNGVFSSMLLWWQLWQVAYECYSISERDVSILEKDCI